MQLITVDDVVYFQADSKYTRVVTATCEALIKKVTAQKRNQDTAANPPFPPTPLSFRDTFVDGNVSLQWHFSAKMMAYIAFGRGTTTGGFAETNTIPSGNPAKDASIGTETTNAVELGIKTPWLGDAFKLNMSIFQMQIADFQDTTFTGKEFVTENLPLRSEGVDIDGEWQATSSLILGARLRAKRISAWIPQPAGLAYRQATSY